MCDAAADTNVPQVQALASFDIFREDGFDLMVLERGKRRNWREIRIKNPPSSGHGVFSLPCAIVFDQESIIARSRRFSAHHLVKNRHDSLGHPSFALAGLDHCPSPWVTAPLPHELPKDQDRCARRWHCRYLRCCECIGVCQRIFDSPYSQQAISDASVSDFLIVEYNSEIGGRVRHTEFGKDPDGKPYTVELGANWVCTKSPYRATHRIQLNSS